MNHEICICENIYRINTAKLGEEITFDWSSSLESSSFFFDDSSDYNISYFEDFETFEVAKMPATRIVVVVFLILFLVIGVPLNTLILMTSIRFRKQSPSSSWEGFSSVISIIRGPYNMVHRTCHSTWYIKHGPYYMMQQF